MPSSRKLDNLTNVAILLVLAYIAFRPGGLVSDIIGARLERSRVRKAVDKNWSQLLALGSPLSVPNAPVKVVFEFSDYQCPYCREQHQRLKSLLRAHRDVELRLLHFPLPSHPLAAPAAKAALCAESQGKLAEMHDRLFETAPLWSEGADWTQHAQAVGVSDLARFRTCMDDPETAVRLDRARRLGRELGVQATPTFITRTEVKRGALPDSAFIALVEAH